MIGMLDNMISALTLEASKAEDRQQNVTDSLECLESMANKSENRQQNMISSLATANDGIAENTKGQEEIKAKLDENKKSHQDGMNALNATLIQEFMQQRLENAQNSELLQRLLSLFTSGNAQQTQILQQLVQKREKKSLVSKVNPFSGIQPQRIVVVSSSKLIWHQCLLLHTHGSAFP